MLKTGLLFLFTLSAYAQVWIPQERMPGEIVQHFAYTLSYNEQHEVPNWVAYALRPEHMRDCFSRTDRFRADPDVSTGSADPGEYARSGYDRGHLAPAGDMKWSATAMDESFYMSNMVPQSPTLNRGRWRVLETLVRAWAKRADELIIVTGPILQGRILGQFGRNGVSVPEKFYKVLLQSKAGKLSAIGFVFDQSPAEQDLKTYVLPIRTIEDLTGLDFFPHLRASTQDTLESEVQLSDWDFRATFGYSACGQG